MLVDLGRNDVGRVAQYGTVRVTEALAIERYSHVQHLVSEVRGRLRPGYDALDVFRACFPAGTVTGAPKVRAMEIIDELEPERRGPYAGAVGYVGWGAASLDTAIAIRAALVLKDRVVVQAGAGSVAERRRHVRQGGVPGQGSDRTRAAAPGGPDPGRIHEPQGARPGRHDRPPAAGERVRGRAGDRHRPAAARRGVASQGQSTNP